MTDPDRQDDGLHIALPADPLIVPKARRLVRDRLREWDLNDSEGATLLVVSELVTNALRHGRPPLELRVERRDEGVRVEVHDAAHESIPVVKTPPPDAVDGRGMRIVATLAIRWGTDQVDNGKRVWAEIDGPASSLDS